MDNLEEKIKNIKDDYENLNDYSDAMGVSFKSIDYIDHLE